MALDPYSACICGSGKKLKFCCADVAAELNKAITLLSGEQFQACLEYLDQQLAKHPGNPSLLFLREAALIRLRRMPQAREAAAEFVRLHPTNTQALVSAAIHEVQQGEPRQGVRLLNAAFEHSTGTLPNHLLTSLAPFAQSLFMRGLAISAHAHLMVALALNPKDEQINQLYEYFCSESRIPLFLKEDRNLIPPPADAPWHDELAQILNLWQRVQWVSAEEMLTPLADRHPESAILWRNLATLRGMIADHEGMAIALHHYAGLDIPEDDAVEALALAQWFSERNPEELVSTDRVVVPVTDYERADAALQGSSLTFKVPVEEIEWKDPMPDAAQGSDAHLPPPKRAYLILDRPMPATGAGITLETLPGVLCEAFLFGRETDREPRLELRVDRDRLSLVQAKLQEIAGDALGAPGEPRELNRVLLEQREISAHVIPPPDILRDDFLRLVSEKEQEGLLHRWTQIPMKFLQGKTPAQAAQDPALRVPLLASIFLLEHSPLQSPQKIAALRSHLGVPQPAAVTVPAEGIADVPLVRLGCVQLEGLSFEELSEIWQRMTTFHVSQGAEQVGLKLIEHAASNEDNELAEEVYGELATLAPSFDKVLEYTRKARDEADRHGRSSAMWDLDELRTLLELRDLPAAMPVIEHLQSVHGREPGVLQALMQLLQEQGLIRPDQAMPGPVPAGAARAATAPAIVPAAAPAAGGSKLWTPGGESEASSSGKSAIWTPGS